MNRPAPAEPPVLAYRRQARVLLRHPGDTAAHLSRVGDALAIPGTEALQGALADLFHATGATQAGIKAAALAMIGERLPLHQRRRFEAWVERGPLPRITPLATRWSVLVRPSADVITRSRRCSPDESRARAQDAVAACAAGDDAAQEMFLHHCLTCRDRLAFMLARRELLRTHERLPRAWAEVGAQLEEQPA